MTAANPTVSVPLVPKWKTILLRAWSMWGLYALAVVTAADAALPHLDAPWWLKLAIIAGACGARLVRQPGASK